MRQLMYKIILHQKITQSETDKLSDNIIQSYLEIDKQLNLTIIKDDDISNYVNI